MQLLDYSDFITQWMYLERYVNLGSDHKFRFQSDAPAQYLPDSEHSHFNVFSLECEHTKEGVGFPDIYPVHPYTAELYAGLGHKLQPTNYKVVPTSSTRTMLLLHEDPAKSFFVKLDLPVKISRFNRAINRSDVIFSQQINKEIGEFFVDSRYAFGFFREVGGGHTILKDGRNAGYLTRDLLPTWHTPNAPAKYFLVPSFSMIAPDLKAEEKTPLLIQILQDAADPATEFLEQILKPVVDLWFSLAKRGILWEMQQQNTLFVLDENKRPIGVAARDFDGAYIDVAQRQAMGLDTLFVKHLLTDPESKEIRYSNIFDHRVCKQNLMRLIHCYGEYYSVQEADEVKKRLRDYILATMPDFMCKILPENDWYTVPEVLFKDGLEMEKAKNPPLR